jgi:hypothetical protein
MYTSREGVHTARTMRIFGVLLLLAAPAVVLAQLAPQAPARYLVQVTQVKPEMLSEWMDLQKNEVNPA